MAQVRANPSDCRDRWSVERYRFLFRHLLGDPSKIHERVEEMMLRRNSVVNPAFAAGSHRCGGSRLARIELQEALPRLKNLRLQPGAKIRHYFGVMVGLAGLPVEWDVD